jgi:hypothetical protein
MAGGLFGLSLAEVVVIWILTGQLDTLGLLGIVGAPIAAWVVTTYP